MKKTVSQAFEKDWQRKDNVVEVRHPENKNHLAGFQNWQVLKETGFFLPKKKKKKLRKKTFKK